MAIRIIKTDDPLNDADVTGLRDLLRSGTLAAGGPGGIDVPAAVGEIISDVEARGDRAVIELTERLENVRLTSQTLRVSADEIASAHASADSEFLALVCRVIANIRRYQEHILIKAPPPLKDSGSELSIRYTPIDRVCVYVPGGRALYPSTVLMTAVPAQVAGVEQIAMLSPPTTDGDIHPMVLALAGELGIDEVYRASGTPGVAALAIGTESMPAVRKITGPGNAFIAEAKRQLFGRIGIDSIAGPSEVLIVADHSANAEYIAADMLAQAEHNPGSAILVTTSQKLAQEVALAIEMQIVNLDRLAALREALENYCAIIVVADIDSACELANDFATEHLQIITEDDRAVLKKIQNAGAIFVGSDTPVPLGDYYAGPSHVLPTGGGAKFFSPLSCNDFLKSSSIIEYDSSALSSAANDTINFATQEGLTAHAAAIKIRQVPKNK